MIPQNPHLYSFIKNIESIDSRSSSTCNCSCLSQTFRVYHLFDADVTKLKLQNSTKLRKSYLSCNSSINCVNPGYTQLVQHHFTLLECLKPPYGIYYLLLMLTETAQSVAKVICCHKYLIFHIG